MPLSKIRLFRPKSESGNIGALRLFKKLALFLVPAFTLPAAVGLFWLTNHDLTVEHDRLTARIGNAAARVASAIERHLDDSYELDSDTVLDESPLPQALINTLLSDQAVLCAELVVTDSGEVKTFTPPGIGCKGQVIDTSVEIPILADQDLDLIVYLSMQEIGHARQSRQNLSFLMLMGALVIALIACWCGFRLIVGRPLGKLLQAIIQSERQGNVHLVDYRANDELGRVAGAFNDMQRRLGAEALRVELTLNRLDRVYNSTPTLLYSSDDQGRIVSVSDHWLYSTGYDRKDVVGKPVKDFLKESSIELYETDVKAPLERFEPVNDVPLVLCRKDRSEIDILLSAIKEQSNDQQNGDALCVMSDISALKAAERQLAQLALTDPLSNLANRRSLLITLEHMLQDKQKAGLRSAVLFIDLDDFKWINDTYGHEIGDALLIAASARLRECTRDGDLIARIGGDEFAIIYHKLKDQRTVELLAARIIDRFKEPFILGEVLGFVSASVGIALVDEQHDTADEILRLADLAMYKAKQMGKSTYVTYTDSIGEQAREAAEIREYIRQGLEQDSFSLCFQPIIDLKTGLVTGSEALLRLTSPARGAIPPDIFIPVAEETGQIFELGTYALKKGIEALEAIQQLEDHQEFYLAINLSPKQLNNQFEGVIDNALASHPHLARHLVLEITETMLLQRSDEIFNRLFQLHERGIRIAMDDFGTGYSSLSHIQNFPVDIIKIDKSFIQQLDQTGKERQRALAMVRATAAMANDLGIKTVAEGVETESSLALLSECKIDLLQGYYYSRPLPFDDFCDWLGERKRSLPPQTQSAIQHALTHA